MARTRLAAAVIGVVVSTTATGMAFAADVPRREFAPQLFVAVPAFTWTGFHVGINAGYGFGSGGDRDTVVVPGTVGGSQSGFVGGGRVGYSYQVTLGSGLVLGVETDLQYADLDGQTNRGTVVNVRGTPTFVALGGDAGVSWFGTARGRFGYPVDRALLYATGGLAYGRGDGSVSCPPDRGRPSSWAPVTATTRSGSATPSAAASSTRSRPT
jgi:outer membrane immunogenic protein